MHGQMSGLYALLASGFVPNHMLSKVNALDAVAAAKGFYTCKGVVAAARR